MKKIVSILICAVLLMSLWACGEDTQGQTEPQNTQASGNVTQPSQTESQPDESTEATAESTAADLKALAESCIDKTVEELYALIGEPESAEYAPSCLGDGEDGNLNYEDFTVYTYKENGKEVVTYVE